MHRIIALSAAVLLTSCGTPAPSQADIDTSYEHLAKCLIGDAFRYDDGISDPVSIGAGILGECGPELGAYETISEAKLPPMYRNSENEDLQPVFLKKAAGIVLHERAMKRAGQFPGWMADEGVATPSPSSLPPQNAPAPLADAVKRNWDCMTDAVLRIDDQKLEVSLVASKILQACAAQRAVSKELAEENIPITSQQEFIDKEDSWERVVSTHIVLIERYMRIHPQATSLPPDIAIPTDSSSSPSPSSPAPEQPSRSSQPTGAQPSDLMP